MELDRKIDELATKLKFTYLDGYISVAESCTGGMLCSAITGIDGSSRYFDRGFITYSNKSKSEILGVNPITIEKYGAVSRETAEEMAIGAIMHSSASISVSITGIAGPSGGTQAKPKGTVFICVASIKILSQKIDFQEQSYNRSIIEPIYNEEFLEKSKMSTTEYIDIEEYINIIEERNQDLTTKLHLGTELQKGSKEPRSNYDITTSEFLFNKNNEDRETIRKKSCIAALEKLIERINLSIQSSGKN